VKATVISNNGTSPFFDFNIGVRQEDAAPAFLFPLFVYYILTNLNDNIGSVYTG